MSSKHNNISEVFGEVITTEIDHYHAWLIWLTFIMMLMECLIKYKTGSILGSTYIATLF